MHREQDRSTPKTLSSLSREFAAGALRLGAEKLTREDPHAADRVDAPGAKAAVAPQTKFPAAPVQTVAPQRAGASPLADVTRPAHPPASSPDSAQQVSTQWLWWTACFLGAVAPFVAGLRARERRWAVTGGLMLLVEIIGIALTGDSESPATAVENFGYALFAVCWIYGIVFVATSREQYRAKMTAAAHLEAQEAFHSSRNAERERARTLARKDPAEALRRGVGRPDIPGSAHGWVVDVNHAPASVLQTLPGIDPDLALRIVATRGTIGLVSSVDDLGHVLDLDHRTVERLRATAVAVEI